MGKTLTTWPGDPTAQALVWMQDAEDQLRQAERTHDKDKDIWEDHAERELTLAELAREHYANAMAYQETLSAMAALQAMGHIGGYTSVEQLAV